MICPRCGYDMENKSKCLRCGYEVKTLAVVNDADDKKSEDVREEKIETKVIDPCNVYLTHPYGVDDDDFYSGFSGSPFGSIFDMLFGDPISDLLGGLFGMDTGRPRQNTGRGQDEQPKKKRKQGPIVDVSADEVELYDENGNPVKPEKSDEKRDTHAGYKARAESAGQKTGEHSSGAHSSGTRSKNPFRRGNRKK